MDWRPLKPSGRQAEEQSVGRVLVLANLLVLIGWVFGAPAGANPPGPISCDHALETVITELGGGPKVVVGQDVDAYAKTEHLGGTRPKSIGVDQPTGVAVGKQAGGAAKKASVGKVGDPPALFFVDDKRFEVPLRPLEYEGPPSTAVIEEWAAGKLQARIPGVKGSDLKLKGVAEGYDDMARVRQVSIGGTRRVYTHPTDPDLMIKVFDPNLLEGMPDVVAKFIRRERDGQALLKRLGINFAEVIDDPELLKHGIIIQRKARGRPLRQFRGYEDEYPEIKDFFRKIDEVDDQLKVVNKKKVDEGGFGLEGGIFKGSREQGFDGPEGNCFFDPPPPAGTGHGITCFDF